MDKCDDIFLSNLASFVSRQMLYLLAKYSQMHYFIQCILFFSLKSGEWDWARLTWVLGYCQNESSLKMGTHSNRERMQNETTVKMRTHSKWERIQNERTYAKWEQPQNGNTLKMTKQSAIKIHRQQSKYTKPISKFYWNNFDTHQVPYEAHVTENVKVVFAKENSNVAIIPRRLTSVL